MSNPDPDWMKELPTFKNDREMLAAVDARKNLPEDETPAETPYYEWKDNEIFPQLAQAGQVHYMLMYRKGVPHATTNQITLGRLGAMQRLGQGWATLLMQERKRKKEQK